MVKATITAPADIQHEHESFIYPVVRVLAQGAEGTAVGSGVCVYSKDGKSYILTNWHVIAPLIHIEKKWDAVANRKLDVETRLPAQVEFFRYKNLSRISKQEAEKAQLVGWNDQFDLALLELDNEVSYTAELMSEDEADNDLFTRDQILTVGCGLGVPPFATDGTLASIDHFEIEGKPFMMATAPAIFGNSGGPAYHKRSGKVAGLVARISIGGGFFFAAAVTHMSWLIPPSTIAEFLRDSIYDFIIDPSRTPEQCEKERRQISEKSKKAQRLGSEAEDDDEA